jgi:hypothetical protein
MLLRSDVWRNDQHATVGSERLSIELLRWLPFKVNDHVASCRGMRLGLGSTDVNFWKSASWTLPAS